MRDNFRPNLRLTTNILLVIGTFLIAFKIGSLNKYTRNYQQRKAACAGTYALNLPEAKKEFLKRYKLENYLKSGSGYRTIDTVIENFCQFYMK